MRLLHLMALVAAVALTLIITPALMRAITEPDSGWFVREQLAYHSSIAMTFWTPILGVIAVIGNRSRIRRVSRSYGISAIFAASSAIFLLFVRGLISVLFWYYSRGKPIFPNPKSYYSPMARRQLALVPEGAAAAIVAVWLILASTGAGRRPSGWFDRFCFLFGLLWVLWYFGRDFMFLLPWL